MLYAYSIRNSRRRINDEVAKGEVQRPPEGIVSRQCVIIELDYIKL